MTNPINRQRFNIGDRVKLNRSINGKNDSFNYPKGSIGVVTKIHHISAVRVKFAGDREPIIASIYLSKVD